MRMTELMGKIEERWKSCSKDDKGGLPGAPLAATHGRHLFQFTSNFYFRRILTGLTPLESLLLAATLAATV